MVSLADLAMFMRVCALRSFTAAGNEAGVDPALPSAAVRRLEKSLGMTLLVRTSRHLLLTDEGQRYLPFARELLMKVERGSASVLSDEPRGGVLRLAVSAAIGRSILVPWMVSFQAMHPGMRVHMSLDGDGIDPFHTKADGVVRYGIVPGSRMIAMALHETREVLVAAPGYLETRGTPASLHDISPYERFSTRQAHPAPGKATSFAGHRCSDDGAVVRDWAIKGDGVAMLPWLDVCTDVESDRLRIVLPSMSGRSLSLSLGCAQRVAVSSPIRQLHALLARELGDFARRHPGPWEPGYSRR